MAESELKSPPIAPNSKHILVLEDDESIRTSVEKVLIRAGYKVSVAATGRQALQKVQSGCIFDAFLCDIRTPLLSGIDFLREVRKLGQHAPAIFLSGTPMQKDVHELRDLGITSILVKPAGAKSIVEAVRTILVLAA
jgi:CheY-like chemotaxis protein